MAAVSATLVVLALVVAYVGPSWREHRDGAELPSDVPGRLLLVDGHRVHVVERGEGSPLLLVHGFAGSTYDYEEHVLDRLAERHRVIAVDLYGFGWSERDASFHYGWALWSEQLRGTLDALGIERAAVAGHSMGGGAATVFAADHAERVERLILADALYPLEDDEVALPFRAMRTPVLGELVMTAVGDFTPPGSSPAYVARALPTFTVEGTRAAWISYLRDPTRRAVLDASYERIEAPVLVIHGTADTFVPIAAMERTIPRLRTMRVVRLEGGTHFPHRDDPDSYVDEVLAFLSE